MPFEGLRTFQYLIPAEDMTCILVAGIQDRTDDAFLVSWSKNLTLRRTSYSKSNHKKHNNFIQFHHFCLSMSTAFQIFLYLTLTSQCHGQVKAAQQGLRQTRELQRSPRPNTTLQHNTKYHQRKGGMFMTSYDKWNCPSFKLSRLFQRASACCPTLRCDDTAARPGKMRVWWFFGEAEALWVHYFKTGPRQCVLSKRSVKTVCVLDGSESTGHLNP